MPSFQTLRRRVILASSFFLITIAAVAQDGTSEIDRSVKPGDDFYRYANGGWISKTAIPEGQSVYDTRAILIEGTSKRVRDLIQQAASANATRGSIVQKVGDYYAGFMDESSIEAKGLTPLAAEMAAISAITSKTSLSAYLGTTLNSEVDGLTANADHIFGVWINQGFEDADHNLPHLWEGGLGLPDSSSYIDPSAEKAKLRAQYQAHIAAMLKLAGFSESETRAASVLALEIRIAQSHAPDRALIGIRHGSVFGKLNGVLCDASCW